MKQPSSSSNPLKKLFWNAARAVTVALDVAILPATLVVRSFNISFKKIQETPSMSLGDAVCEIFRTLGRNTLAFGVIPGVAGSIVGGFTESATVGLTTAYLTAEGLSLLGVAGNHKTPAKDYIQFMPLTRRLDHYRASLSAPNP